MRLYIAKTFFEILKETNEEYTVNEKETWNYLLMQRGSKGLWGFCTKTMDWDVPIWLGLK